MTTDDMARRLTTIPGEGAVTAATITTFAPPMETYSKGLDFAAWVGLTPRQRSSGGKDRLGRTSKAGQRDIRRLLIVGAVGVVRWAAPKGAPGGSWLVVAGCERGRGNVRADGQETGSGEPAFRTERHRARVSELVLTCISPYRLATGDRPHH